MVLVMRAVGKGWYYNKKNNILEFSHQQYLKDILLTTTEKTALVMAEIANAINSNVQVTYDSPKKNATIKIRPQYGSIHPSHSNICPLMIILWQNIYIFVPKRNTGLVLSFYMLASKSRPQYRRNRRRRNAGIQLIL